MANRIVLNTVSYHGKGAIVEIANELAAHGSQKAFVCTDADLVKSPVCFATCYKRSITV
jgi:lactaldehyde reductase